LQAQLYNLLNCDDDIGDVCTLCIAAANVCQFPAYLRRASSPTAATSSSSGWGAAAAAAESRSWPPGDSQWATELRYSPVTDDVQSRLDIVVLDTEMTAKVSFAVQCQARSSGATERQLCYQTELVYRSPLNSLTRRHSKWVILDRDALPSSCISWLLLCSRLPENVRPAIHRRQVQSAPQRGTVRESPRRL